MPIAQTSAMTGLAASVNTVIVASMACLVGEAGRPMRRAGTKENRTSRTVRTSQMSRIPRDSGRAHQALARRPASDSYDIAPRPPGE